jgi:hypothetical protein
MRRITTPLAMLCAALAATLALAGPAGASSRQVSIMQDDQLLFRSSSATRHRTLDEMKALGTDVVRIQVYWNEIAPRKKPTGFDGSNPGSYNWSAYDDFVRSVVARGMRPMLTLGNRAPAWATRKPKHSHHGTYRPSARQFERFVRAAGRRYSGAFLGLPRVILWSIWNEPNLSGWLQPQRTRSGKTPLSPSIYRNLYLAGYRGLRDTGHRRDTILIGELAPTGTGTKRKVSPLSFLREMFCLNSHYRQIRGRAAKRRGCKRVKRIPTSGLAYHPYTPRGGPRSKPRNRNDAGIGQLSRVSRVLNALSRRKKLSRRRPIWITEYGFQTNPPDIFQFPIRRVPGYMDTSEWIAFRNGRVKSVDQFSLKDERLKGRGFRRYAAFQQGLRFSNGKKKKGVYAAWRMPAYVRARGRRVEVFAGLRSAARGTAVAVYSRRKGHHYRKLGSGRVNVRGYFRKVFHVSGASHRVYRIKIAGHSRTKHPARR